MIRSPDHLDVHRRGIASRMAVRKMLAKLVAEIPKAMREPAATALILRHSDRLPALQIVAQSWFEDDPQVAVSIERAPCRQPPLRKGNPSSALASTAIVRMTQCESSGLVPNRFGP